MQSVGINLTIPVYNEEKRLVPCLERLIPFLQEKFGDRCDLVIADNASTDRTGEIALRYASNAPFLSYVRMEERGRGRAIRQIWSNSTADILSYMDVDLSTDLEFFPLLIKCLEHPEFDIAVGSRALAPALTQRGFKREVLSRGYRLLLNSLFRVRFSDPQCGFKAIKRSCAAAVLPLVKNQCWFFDTEMLVIAQAMGFKIYDLPVIWRENSDSRVALLSTIQEDILGLLRLRFRMAGISRRKHS